MRGQWKLRFTEWIINCNLSGNHEKRRPQRWIVSLRLTLLNWKLIFNFPLLIHFYCYYTYVSVIRYYGLMSALCVAFTPIVVRPTIHSALANSNSSSGWSDRCFDNRGHQKQKHTLCNNPCRATLSWSRTTALMTPRTNGSKVYSTIYMYMMHLRWSFSWILSRMPWRQGKCWARGHATSKFSLTIKTIRHYRRSRI